MTQARALKASSASGTCSEYRPEHFLGTLYPPPNCSDVGSGLAHIFAWVKRPFLISCRQSNSSWHTIYDEMIPLQRVALKFGARSPWLRLPRSRFQHAQRNSSNSTSPKDSTKPPTRNQLPSHTLNGAIVEAAKTEPVDIPIQLWYHRLGPVSTFFTWFDRMQLKRPYTVQLCTVLTTYLCGDLLAQDIGGELYDPIRTLRMLTIGAIAAIPGYKWYVMMNSWFPYCQEESHSDTSRPKLYNKLTERSGSSFSAVISTSLPELAPSRPKLPLTKSSLRPSSTLTSLGCKPF